MFNRLLDFTQNIVQMQVDLTGGYYDAGDNVKYGLPMAFTITTLSWGALHYEKELTVAGEIQNVRDAIKWGTDYFLKATETPNQIWAQVLILNERVHCILIY